MYSISFTFFLWKFSNVHRSKETPVPSMFPCLTLTIAYLVLSINLWGYFGGWGEYSEYFEANLRHLTHKSNGTN